MRKGDRLYSVWNGKLETFAFLEESIVEGAFSPTMVVRNMETMCKIRCSLTHCLPTKKAAWELYLTQCEKNNDGLIEHLKDLAESMKANAAEIVRVKAQLAKL